jgi:hypothetical protein
MRSDSETTDVVGKTPEAEALIEGASKTLGLVV